MVTAKKTKHPPLRVKTSALKAVPKRAATVSLEEAVDALPPVPKKAKNPGAANLVRGFQKGHDPRRYMPVPQLQKITDMKRRLLAKSGMTPLDFLTAVYRDELYDDYEPAQIVEVLDPRLLPYARIWKPTDTARRVKLNLDQRIAAANMAAPFFHSKRPTQLNVGGGGPLTPGTLTKAQMEAMTDEELDLVIRAGEVLGALPRADVTTRVGLGGTVSLSVATTDDDRTIDA